MVPKLTDLNKIKRKDLKMSNRHLRSSRPRFRIIQEIYILQKKFGLILHWSPKTRWFMRMIENYKGNQLF